MTTITGRSPTFTNLGSFCSAQRADQEYQCPHLCKRILAGENSVKSHALYRATRRSLAADLPSLWDYSCLDQRPKGTKQGELVRRYIE